MTPESSDPLESSGALESSDRLKSSDPQKSNEDYIQVMVSLSNHDWHCLLAI